MKDFMDSDFLLSNDTAKQLYHDYASKLPIIDYHCHINPEEIAKDRHFNNITQIWLGGDHYKWRFLRSCGVDEYYITGSASDYEKFEKWAECLGKAIGNPLYHWSHLELQRYFGYNGYLNKNTCKKVWDLCNEILQKPDMGVKNIIRKSNVKLICTTDDPIDSLCWHDVIKEDKSFETLVLPAWRPDKAMNIEKDSFTEYINKLSEVSLVKISSFKDLKDALSKRMDYFESKGCCVSDHALEYIMYAPALDDKIEEIFRKKLSGDSLSELEVKQYKTAFMIFMACECKKRNWVCQLHYGCLRDNNKKMFELMGPDTGFDSIDNFAPSGQMASFLNALEYKDSLPKTILYSLNPNDNAAIGTILGCFQSSECISKIQQGSAWWFNDNKIGMENQLLSLANLGNLSGFVGMLTDSRSFLSYTRHEYFRRILCNVCGMLVENGEFPNDKDTLKDIVEGISYFNAIKYFGFSIN